ncbi:MAG: HAMP domain-containing histidine kinase [Kofleriaceae bacterium]|nr:HAMP domain-containing histidine kinase [Kofleriaceae bacterium]MBP9207751.1 HAMP domain-containing histidine kinase [Kofleriaceae bacterium]
MSTTAAPARLELARLVGVDELAELCERGHALGPRVVVTDRAGRELAAAGAARPTIDAEADATVRVPLRVEVELVGAVEATGPGAAEVAALVASAVEIAAHHGLATQLASATHEAAISESFAELAARHHELEVALGRMREVDRLKRNFLSTMSHELRTPLTSVIGYSEMLIEGLAGPVAPVQREYLMTILGKADQLLQMISAVLEVANLESGVAPLGDAAIALAPLVEEVIAGFAEARTRRGVTISVRGDGAVQGDRTRLRQVVTHLLSNAVKFTRDGGAVEVDIHPGPARRGEAGVDAVHLVVRDSGVGIAADVLDRIFEPFFQADSSSTREFGGTGIGLTLARAYVEAHGGAIWVESALGHGATFVAALPPAPADAGDVAGSSAPGA